MKLEDVKISDTIYFLLGNELRTARVVGFTSTNLIIGEVKNNYGCNLQKIDITNIFAKDQADKIIKQRLIEKTVFEKEYNEISFKIQEKNETSCFNY
jgi:hypothetical protein